MRQVLLALASAFALSACGQNTGTTEPPAQTAAAEGCSITVSTPWRPLSGVEFNTTATTTGATCASAEATITISYGANQELYRETYPTAQVMLLAPAHDEAAMRAALADWLSQDHNQMNRTSTLPDWPAGADAPTASEFPFYVEEGVTRDQYVAWRNADVPMFCYVQGMESLACLGWRDERFTKIGVQSFPG